MPVGPTRTTVESVELQVAPEASTRSFCDGTTTCTVSSPSGGSATRDLESATSADWTSTGAVAMSPLAAAAWMIVRPSAIAVTSPELSTAAMSGRSDFQVTAPGSPVLPLSVTACGTSRPVSPGRSRSEAGSKVSVTPARRAVVPGAGSGSPVGSGHQHGQRAAAGLGPGLDPRQAGRQPDHDAVRLDPGDGRVRATESEAGIGDEVALPIEGSGENGLLLPDGQRHRLRGDLYFGHGLGCQPAGGGRDMASSDEERSPRGS